MYARISIVTRYTELSDIIRTPLCYLQCKRYYLTTFVTILKQKQSFLLRLVFIFFQKLSNADLHRTYICIPVEVYNFHGTIAVRMYVRIYKHTQELTYVHRSVPTLLAALMFRPPYRF